MKKKSISIFVMFILVSCIFVAAQEAEDECGFWCKVGKSLFGTGEEEKALVGKAGGIWGREEALVGKAEEAPPEIIGLPNRLSREEAKEAETFNSESENSRFGLLLINLNKDKELVRVLEKNGIDVDRLRVRNPAEIQKLQALVRVGTDGKWGETSQRALGEKSSEIKEGKVVLIGSEAAPLPPSTLQEDYEAADREATRLEALAKELKEKAVEAGQEYTKHAEAIDTWLKNLKGAKLDEYGRNQNMQRQADEKDDNFKKRIKTQMLKETKARKDEAEEAAAEAKKTAEETRKEANHLRWSGTGWGELKGTWAEDWLDTADNPLGYTLGPVLRLAQRAGRYQGLSNLLMPELTQRWFDVTNSRFFKVLDVVGAVTKEWCDYDEKMTADIPGQNAVFIEVAKDTYQFVGRIQAERSASPTYILCHPENKTCPSNFICKDDLCYEEDGEEPVEGYLYKIEWGVTAPQDEKHTPYVDENGKAVKFNVMIKYKGKTVWLYEREGAARKEAIELENGESDRSMWLKYLEGEVSEACVIFSDNAYSTDRYGRHEIKEICASIEPVTAGEVEYGKAAPSQKVSTGEVTEATDIW